MMVLICHNNNTLLCASGDKIVAGNPDKDLIEYNIPEPMLSENLTKGQIEVIKKERRSITWMECSKDGQYIAVTTENKQLVVFNKSFQIVKHILLQRVSSKVCFSNTNDVLVADRTGDVYMYNLHNLDEPILLLGHLSVILNLIVSHCGRYIITSDRDEKIRVSYYPNAYNIVTYCLGHTEFINVLKLLKNNILLSASGDGTVRMWDYLQGKQLNILNTVHLGEEKVLKSFVSEMEKESVDVTALPITDMQVHEAHYITVALSLYKTNKIYIFQLDPESLNYTYITKTIVDSEKFYFYLTNVLYILSNNLTIFKLENNLMQSVDCTLLQQKLEKYKELFMYDNSGISLLYKRKYDNIQEYFERKKQRLNVEDNKS